MKKLANAAITLPVEPGEAAIVGLQTDAVKSGSLCTGGSRGEQQEDEKREKSSDL